MLALVMLSLTGCDALNKARDTLEGVLEPVVVEGIVLGIEAPQGQGVDQLLEGTDYQAGTSVTVFIADAREVSEIENAPVTGADVVLSGPGVSVPIAETGGGVYTHVPSGDLPYDAEATWELTVTRSSEEAEQVSVASLILPTDHDHRDAIPTEHTLATGIDIDFTGLGYDAALLVVLDETGIVYSNEPTDIQELYTFTHGNGDLGVVTVPGDVFDSETLYLVGVAGMTNTRAADLDEMNTALSTVMMGKMRFYTVSTANLPL